MPIRPLFRRLRRTPVFSAIAVLVLALGFGATAALLALLDHLVFQAAPYPQSSRLVAIWRTLPDPRYRKAQFNAASALELLAPAKTLDGAACLLPDGVSFSEPGRAPRSVEALRVSAAFFEVLRQRPLQGRLAFTPEEDRWGGPRVVIVAEEFWNRQGREPDLTGRSLNVNGMPHTVVGILPKGFRSPTGRADRPQVFLPLAFSPRERAERGANYELVGRLAPGADREAAQTELQARVQALGWTREGIRLQGLRQSLGEGRLPLLSLLLASALLVLLAAAGNLAGLFLARGIARRAESALRSALGATRGRITRDMLQEGLVISLGGATLGLGLAQVLFLALGGPLGLPQDLMASSGTTFLATGLLTFPVALVAGAWPAWRSAGTPPREALGGGGSSRTDLRLRRTVVGAQVALATAFLVGAVTLLRSLDRQALSGPGFPMEGLLVGGLQLPASGFPGEEDRHRAWERLTAELQGMPGVQGVGILRPTPMKNTGGSGNAQDADRDPEGGVEAWRHWASPGVFPSLGQPLLKGRTYRWDELDACVVSLPLAQTLWPGQDPLGRRLRFGPGPLTVVGVVAGTKEFGLAESVRAQYFISPRHFKEPGFDLLLRFRGPGREAERLVGDAVARLHPDMAPPALVPFERFAARALEEGRTLNLLALGFAALVLLLASLGLAGTVSAGTASRLQELGMRAALGAGPVRLLGAALAADALVAGLGMALGLGLGAAFGNLLHSQLYGTSALEPVAFLAALAAVGSALVLCALGPGLRVLGLNPSQALRHV